MVRYYYAITDELGVLCVDQIDSTHEWTEEQAAKLASQYPEIIYFEISGNP